MYRSFWAWRGNVMTAEASSWLYYLLFVFVLSILCVGWIYKKQLTNYWTHKTKILYMPKRIFEILSGLFIIIFMIIRIIILEFDDAPYKWEYIPLHFCRMFVLIAGILLIIDKKHWVKYVGFFAILGGLIGLLLPDIKNTPESIAMDQTYNSLRSPIDLQNLGKNLGMDNYHWWDYILAHSFVVLTYFSFYVVVDKKSRVDKTTFILSVIGLVILTIVVFFINWIIDATVTDFAWRSNWFFLGKKGIDTLGQLTQWPIGVFTLLILGFVAILITLGIYFIQAKVDFKFNNKGFVTKVLIKKSANWHFFKNSHFKYWNKKEL